MALSTKCAPAMLFIKGISFFLVKKKRLYCVLEPVNVHRKKKKKVHNKIEGKVCRFLIYPLFICMACWICGGLLHMHGLSHYQDPPRASLVAQWLRICLPMQGTRVQALVWEDPTCRGATRPVSHNY